MSGGRSFTRQDQACREMSALSQPSVWEQWTQKANIYGVLQLLAGLDEEATWRELDLYPLAGVSRPHVQPREARSPVDRQEVEIRVEPGKDCVGKSVSHCPSSRPS